MRMPNQGLVRTVATRQPHSPADGPDAARRSIGSRVTALVAVRRAAPSIKRVQRIRLRRTGDPRAVGHSTYNQIEATK